MIDVFRAAAAADLLLKVCEKLVPHTSAVLPLGADPISQIGVLFTLAFVCDEAIKIWYNRK